MKTYANIKAYREIVDQFRDFAKHQGLMHSQALKLLLDQYHENGSQQGELSPGNNPIVQRIEQTISIIRNIEKNQTKPTLALLQMLFEEHPIKQPPVNVPDPGELSALKDRYKLLLYQIQELIRKIEPVSPLFLKHYFRIQLTDSEYQELLTTFNS